MNNDLSELPVFKTVTFKIPSSYIPQGLWKSQPNDDHIEEIYYCAGTGDRNWYLVLEDNHFVHKSTNPDLFIVDIPKDLTQLGLTPRDLIDFSDYNTVKEGNFYVVRDFYDKYNFILDEVEYESYIKKIGKIKSDLFSQFKDLYDEVRPMDDYENHDPNWRMTTLLGQNVHEAYQDHDSFEMIYREVFYKR